MNQSRFLDAIQEGVQTFFVCAVVPFGSYQCLNEPALWWFAVPFKALVMWASALVHSQRVCLHIARDPHVPIPGSLVVLAMTTGVMAELVLSRLIHALPHLEYLQCNEFSS